MNLRKRTPNPAKPRLLIIGCGDVMARALPWLARRFQIYASARSPESAARLRALGVVPVTADLDAGVPQRLAGIAHWVIHSAPPATSGARDVRTRRLLAALARPARCSVGSSLSQRHSAPRRLAYIGTSGVYGNADGAWVAETRPAAPDSPRAQRRADAESQLRAFARRHGVRLGLLRAPGIYAEGRLPEARIRRGEPAIAAAEDSYSNHIHADDLAQAACLALFRAAPLRSYNASDDAPGRMGDWFDQVADLLDLPRVPRVSRADAQAQVSPGLLSYLNESRRLDNTRIKRELRLQLRWPSVAVWLAAKRSGG
ncbi:NAD-dependent epimerase/dehydratase family protein [Jeongeupia naejangsanensis]|uniref:SDR family NAD(P)-dependent oxidoreductase n=1 Tax=Jeongeupia naejangsanensis TaxID=613195 RepID=A0ABS2BH68_9NEIS|nr:NAD-dependent epimerase/dehydratase family protein [Jeongeupia naejangsanensis]MBM3114946.1 SDR family NAD(P)-dependent oxidoreductase [Jeongeupia naejangsanensis]